MADMKILGVGINLVLASEPTEGDKFTCHGTSGICRKWVVSSVANGEIIAHADGLPYKDAFYYSINGMNK